MLTNNGPLTSLFVFKWQAQWIDQGYFTPKTNLFRSGWCLNVHWLRSHHFKLHWMNMPSTLNLLAFESLRCCRLWSPHKGSILPFHILLFGEGEREREREHSHLFVGRSETDYQCLRTQWMYSIMCLGMCVPMNAPTMVWVSLWVRLGPKVSKIWSVWAPFVTTSH